MKRPNSKAKQVEKRLREIALAYPGAREEFPWGERVVKVGKKVFVFMGMPDGGGLGLSVKLPNSGTMALMFPFATPTGYGLGKSGWVSARFEPGEAPASGAAARLDRRELPRGRAQDDGRAAARGGDCGAKARVTARSPRTGSNRRRPTGKKSSRSTATGR